MKWFRRPRAYIWGGGLMVVGLVMGLFSSGDLDGYMSKISLWFWVLGGSAIGVGLIDRYRHRFWENHPDQEKQYEISQRDERNVAILGRAGYASCIITLFVLFALLGVFLTLGQTLAAWLTGAAMVLHLAGFFTAAAVYDRRM